MTFDPVMFERALQAHRGFGRVFCDVRERTREGEPTPDELDDYVAIVFDDVLDDQWARGGYREVSARYAGQLAAFWLAHPGSDELPADIAESGSAVIEPFFRAFAAPTTCFTNAAKAHPANGARTAFMTKTLLDWDAGIVVVDRVSIGLLWFADDE